MSLIKEYYVEYFENLELLEASDSLMIFTHCEIEPLRECVWSYQFYSLINGEEVTLIKEESGNETLCSCQECKDFGEELFDYYSAFKSLISIKNMFPEFEYCLWSNSEKFQYEAKEEIFGHYDDIYGCDFLKRLGKELAHLLSNVAVAYRSSETPKGRPF